MADNDNLDSSLLSATNHRYRKAYGKIRKIIDIPNLIKMQKESYHAFLQEDVAPDQREDVGLQGVFKSVFPIKDFNETASLEFVQYVLEEPKYDVQECRARGMTFAAPLKVTVRLVLWEMDNDGKAQNIRDVKEQEVYFGEIPLMTKNGTFVVNGTERVVVSQLHRSPGVFFDREKLKTVSVSRTTFTGRVIPYRGSWLDFEFDAKDFMYVRIDRRRKFPATILLRALSLSDEQIINYFYEAESYKIDGKKITKNVVPNVLPGQLIADDIKDSKGKVILQKGRRYTRFAIKNLQRNEVSEIPATEEELFGRITAKNVVDPMTGEIILEVNQQITEDIWPRIKEAKIDELSLIYINNQTVSSSLRDTLLMDKVDSPEEAMMEIYKRLRPGDPPTPESSRAFFKGLFFEEEKYDLAQVGRLKMNHKFKLDTSLDQRVLTNDDILSTIKYLLDLKVGKGEIDDIDHLGNRRVRSVSELLENQYRVGLVRMERAIKERLSLQELDTLMPHELINAKPVSAVVKEFFGTSQLSQFMDQTNPLSEITHKRRLSALGPGGLTRDRAGFEVRDVHPTHYGRICPIETPEGPNIGLIASLSSYARINDFGFIETPYRKVEGGRVTDEVVYCSALEEQEKTIAQASVPVDKSGKMTEELVSARRSGAYLLVDPSEVNLVDVSPYQIVSVAAALIPFLEHDDANRALMGSNMQRQAVPLVKTRSPVVGTGMEGIVAADSGVTVVAEHTGWIENVDSARIVLRIDTKSKDYEARLAPPTGVEIYSLLKYQRSNQNTCINQRPIVKKGQYVKKGEVIADGPATELGELALGQNVTVAFMSWGGYNFEDSILISERAVRDDLFTSIHIEEFEVLARDTKLGVEEITRDIPNAGDDALASLDESGIVKVGTKIRPGDILVGKVTPKGESQLSPEEKLLRAIFGEKAVDVKDTSLRVPPGVVGTVINARVFQREGVDKDERAQMIEDSEIQRILRDQEDEIRIIRESGFKVLEKLLVGQTTNAPVEGSDGAEVLKKGETITEESLARVSQNEWRRIPLQDESIESEVRAKFESMSNQIESIKLVAQNKMEKLSQGDELPPGVIKMVKVYIAIKRKIEVGDKMAGRHGNKGVISRVLPEEDLPYMADGTPVDIILNPLGVPSRMNVGQLLETLLGGAATALGRKVEAMLESNAEVEALRTFLLKVYDAESVQDFIKSANRDDLVTFAKKLQSGVTYALPVFDSIQEEDISKALEIADMPTDGRSYLFDGRSGEPFERRVTVGTMYVLKLHHIVEDKIHARSIGPYSIVTQQPLGGKAQFGGQRLGEMEVWALEAYGAAHMLQEFLTVKSDDIVGRTRMYESIVKGEYVLEPGLPESFNVLVKELRGLCLNVELLQEEGEESAS